MAQLRGVILAALVLAVLLVPVGLLWKASEQLAQPAVAELWDQAWEVDTAVRDLERLAYTLELARMEPVPERLAQVTLQLEGVYLRLNAAEQAGPGASAELARVRAAVGRVVRQVQELLDRSRLRPGELDAAAASVAAAAEAAEQARARLVIASRRALADIGNAGHDMAKWARYLVIGLAGAGLLGLFLLSAILGRVARAQKPAPAPAPNDGQLLIEDRRLETRLSGVLDQLDEGVAVFDKDDRLVAVGARFADGQPDMARVLESGLGFDAAVERITGDLMGEAREAWRAMRRRAFRETNGPWCDVQTRWVIEDRRLIDGGTMIRATEPDSP